MLEWIHFVAIAGVAAAGLMTILWQGATSRGAVLDEKNQQSSARLAAAESALEKEQKARARQATELAELRKKADKSKRRGAKQTSQPMGTASRIQDLEAAGAQASRERDRARIERDDLAAELAGLRAEIEADARRRQAESAAAAVAAVPESSPAESANEPTVESRLAEAQEQIEKLVNERRLARQTEARMRKRMDNQEQLYASLRSELEVKKDRLRTQKEQLQRLQALKVAVLD